MGRNMGGSLIALRKYLICNEHYAVNGGGDEIRTHDTVARIHTFQACAFSRSATPPLDFLMGTTH